MRKIFLQHKKRFIYNRLFFAVFLTLFGMIAVVQETEAKYVYCNMEYDWWYSDGAIISVFYWNNGSGWPGSAMTRLGTTKTWYYNITTGSANCLFARVSGDGSTFWDAQTVDLTVPTGSTSPNCYTISNSTGCYTGSSCKCSGSWVNFALTPTSVNLTVSNALSGAGTAGDPYIVSSEGFTLSATGLTFSPSDPDMVGRYAFGTSENSTPTGTSTTSAQSSPAVGSTVQYYVSVRGYYNGAYSSAAIHKSVYVKTACYTPSAGFAASATYNSGNWTTRFADSNRSATLSTNQLADAYLWECTSANSSKVSIASTTSKSTTATFDLPGTYTFRVGAKCMSDGSFTYSETVTVNVPYPEIGISGPFVDPAGWVHSYAGNTGKFTRDGLVYTKEFTINNASGEFVIIQAYKLGCELNNGWDGYDECGGSAGNKINCSNLTTSTINTNKEWCSNFTQNAGLVSGQSATLTVTMTAYDSYTMVLQNCATPTTYNVSLSVSSICTGGTANVNLDGSQTSVSYQLYKNDSPIGDPVFGTGDSLTFLVNTGGVYKVIATNTVSGCSNTQQMTGTPTLTEYTPPVLTNIEGSDKICSVMSDAGTYSTQFIDGAVYSWTIDVEGVVGTSNTNIIVLTTGAVLSEGTISVKATNDGCESSTINKAITVVTKPMINLVQGTTICGAGTAQIKAVISSGIVDWLLNSEVVGHSNSDTFFTTPNNTATTIYKARANNGGCVSNNNDVQVNVLELTSSSNTVTNYEPVIFSSNMNVDWSVSPTNKAYFATTANREATLKAKNTAGSGNSTQYTVSATPSTGGSCSSTVVITVSDDTETCN
ncbi:MAG: hypothetical protein EOL95_00790 [Bacteroidia bacterium]|nr:hypothetical protein [Bacteroidia bacterium]